MHIRTRKLALPFMLAGLLALPGLGWAAEVGSPRADTAPTLVHGGYRDGHRHDHGYRDGHRRGRGHRGWHGRDHDGRRWRHDRGRWSHWDRHHRPPVIWHHRDRHHHGYPRHPRGRIDLHFWLGGYR